MIVERINTGYGLERNRLGIQIRNNAAESIAVTWLEEWPWWIKVYMHTLRISVNGVSVAQGAMRMASIVAKDARTDLYPFSQMPFCRTCATRKHRLASGLQ